MADTTVAECYFCKVEGDCISDENGKWKCAECASTLPKAEGVGECRCGMRDPDSCSTHHGPQEWLNWLEKWAFNRANSRDGVKNLVTLADAKKALTSATRAAEERKEREILKMVDDLQDKPSGSFAFIDGYDEALNDVHNLIEAMLPPAKKVGSPFLPPPPSKPTQL